MCKYWVYDTTVDVIPEKKSFGSRVAGAGETSFALVVVNDDGSTITTVATSWDDFFINKRSLEPFIQENVWREIF